MKNIILTLFGLVFLSSATIVAAIPENATYNNLAKDGWACKAGYVRHQNNCIITPKYSVSDLNGWRCRSHPDFKYKKRGTKCIPPESYAFKSYCAREYIKSGNKCVFVGKVKSTAENAAGCQYGYVKINNKCVKQGTIPPNAHASGAGWECDFGYVQYGYSCISKSGDEKKKPEEVIDNNVYSASSGSGFAVTSDGYVITNFHVIEGCTEVKIHDKGNAIPATLVTFDPKNDIALLKGNFKPRSYYPLSRKSPKLLTEVYVAGHPFGQEISTSVKVTKGIISSLTGIANNFSNLQIDAALQPGNSGGPIMNDKGNVVGVAVAKLDLETIVDEFGVVPENVNFGVKSNLVLNILESENIDIPEPNNNSIPTTELGEMITDGTYYLSCWMTMAQIMNMKERKVMFSDL